MTRFPGGYVAALLVILALAAVMVLTWFGVPPFDNTAVFVLSNVVGFFAILVLAVLGGAFVGLVLAQRIFVARDFSPFERAVMESLAELKVRLEELESRVGEPPMRKK